ncbi:cathepsin C [Monoraphidium neglectum]|uniref:Cathepsin C n=1 Tax=Monoraphidium neglectum TaxID=145388 RepID=A0A0D2JF24_9CHLO|nr:cathepsin C [Monoraphidium neglectum]KIY98102.1 cathepsin C [Monoraphidium neglectum]|eukprot:XP_013897122.1 cathepsin C [Monoraphidium neglectum]
MFYRVAHAYITRSFLFRAAPLESQPGATEAAVAAEKAAVRAALADPDAAFAAHAAALGAARDALKVAGRAAPPHMAVLADPANLGKYKSAFKKALKTIAALNARSGPSLAYGITPFVHMPHEEFAAAYLGGKRAPPVGGPMVADRAGRRAAFTCIRNHPWTSSGLAALKAHSAVDWRTSTPRAVTSIKNQDSCGSCVVFANIAALEAAYIISKNNTKQGAAITYANTDLSEQDQMDCLEGDACRGADGYEYIDNAICNGVAKESDDPYVGDDNDKCKEVPRAKSGVVGYTFVPGNIADVTRALSHNVISIGVAADRNFQYYRAGVLGCTKSGSLNHETALIAYTEGVQSDQGPMKVFTAKNSWDTYWGEDGFFRFRADCPYPGSLGMFADPYLTVPIRG